MPEIVSDLITKEEIFLPILAPFALQANFFFHLSDSVHRTDDDGKFVVFHFDLFDFSVAL